MKKIAPFVFALFTLASCGISSESSSEVSSSTSSSFASTGSFNWSSFPSSPKQTTYTNPFSFSTGVGQSTIYEGIADPYVLHADDGYFYLVCSNTYAHAAGKGRFFDYGPIWRSADLQEWTYVTSVFAGRESEAFSWGSVPEGVSLQVNAPSLNKIGDNYVFYYTLTGGYDQNPGIGYAYAKSMNGPWILGGELFRCNDIGVFNSSDQDVYVEDGKVYMVFGSGDGIYLIRLTDDGFGLYGGLSNAMATKKWLAGWDNALGNNTNNYEGANLIKRDGRYYLFLSTGGWDGGKSSLYHTLVCSSASLLGPYSDSLGRDMKSAYEGDDVILPDPENVSGTGHTCVYRDDQGTDWIFYHGYDQIGRADGNIRTLFMDKLIYDETTKMPAIKGKTASAGEQFGPYVEVCANEN